MNAKLTILVLCVPCLFAPASLALRVSSATAASPQEEFVAIQNFVDLTSARNSDFRRATETIGENWRDEYLVMLLEACRVRPQRAEEIFRFLVQKTGKDYGGDLNRWFQAAWESRVPPHREYSRFKSSIYALIDPRFSEYFEEAENATIRLEEIRWGGVVRDGIPPLKNPKVLSAREARYLSATDVVFGVVVNGEARAYPKRILAWHEMVKDNLGGESINGVYCTLCGSMIVYLTELSTKREDGSQHVKHFELGTSGFLYRSNKLMYDHDTKSLWSTLLGEPVVGPLVGQGIKLKSHHVVTTNWGQWLKDHPDTTVLSLETGHRRDYGEGVAYRNYFASDRLMFTVPEKDTRLKNKDEVFVLRTGEAETHPLAIAADFLAKKPVYNATIDDFRFVVVTDPSGANRAYASEDVEFVEWAGDSLVDVQGKRWSIAEEELSSQSSGKRLKRIPAHRAFWFGWFSAHPDTQLIK